MHINLLCCCLEHCCHLLLHSLWSNSIQGNQLTSLWQPFDASKNICVCFCDGALPCRHQSPPECSVMCLADVPSTACAPGKEKDGAISKFLLWFQLVVSCYCVEVKRGQYNPAVVRETERREIVEQTGFQASHCSWNFKNFEKSEPISETSNLMNSLRISGRVWEFSKQFI